MVIYSWLLSQNPLKLLFHCSGLPPKRQLIFILKYGLRDKHLTICDVSISQSQSGWGWQGPLCPPGPTPAPAGTSRAGGPGPHPGGFWRSPKEGHPRASLTLSFSLSLSVYMYIFLMLMNLVQFVPVFISIACILMNFPCRCRIPWWNQSRYKRERWTEGPWTYTFRRLGEEGTLYRLLMYKWIRITGDIFLVVEEYVSAGFVISVMLLINFLGCFM